MMLAGNLMTMSDYDKGYIKWFVVAFAIAFGLGLILKSVIVSLPSYSDENLGLVALASFIVPALCIISQFIMLQIYLTNRKNSREEEHREASEKYQAREESADDMILNYEDDDAGYEAQAAQDTIGNEDPGMAEETEYSE